MDLGFVLEDSTAPMYSEHLDRVVGDTPLVVLLLTLSWPWQHQVASRRFRLPLLL